MSKKVSLPFVKIQPISELPLINTLTPGGSMLIEESDGTAKRISTDVFYQLLHEIAIPIFPTDTGPFTANTWHKPMTYTADPGTNYPNAGSLKAIEGYDTLFFYNGTTWIKYANKLPQSENKINTWVVGSYVSGKQVIYTDQSIYEANAAVTSSDVPGVSSKWTKKVGGGATVATAFIPTNSTDAQGAKQIKDFIYQPTTLLSADDWKISEKERHKKIVLSANKTINVSLDDGDEGFLLVEGNGFVLTINGKAISISANPILIGIKSLLGSIIIKYSAVEYINQPIGVYLNFIGSNLTNTSNSWEATVKNGNWGNVGIDSGILAANAAGRIWFQYQPINGGAVLGFTDGSTAVGYAAMKVGFWKNQSPNSWGKSENGTISEFSTLTPVAGRFYGLLRESSGIVRWQYSDDEVTWITIVDFTTSFTGSLRAVCDIRGNTGDKMVKPKRSY